MQVYESKYSKIIARNGQNLSCTTETINVKRQHPVHNYDIVIGPIADDGVTYQLRRYTEGDISMKRLIEELKYAKGLTIQYYFGSERALSYLKRI